MFLLLALPLRFPAPAAAGSERALAPEVSQLIVSIAPTWDSPRGVLMLLEREGAEWRAASPVIPVLYGKHGLAWGRGVAGTDEPDRHKREGDGRAPAGVFALGTIFGDDPALPEGAMYPYRQVTARDAWVDDPHHPLYNRHVVIDDPAQPPPWFEKHRMRLGDAAFRWRVEIRRSPARGASSFFTYAVVPTARPRAAPSWPRRTF